MSLFTDFKISEQEKRDMEKENDEEEEEEEMFLVVELAGMIDNDIISRPQKNLTVLGLDTDEPFLQIDRCVFKGEYEDVVGTCLFFNEKKKRTEDSIQKEKRKKDPQMDQLEYLGKSYKKLNMKRIFLTPKGQDKYSVSPEDESSQT